MGTWSMKWQPGMIMRATQEKRMSKPVARRAVGKKAAKSGSGEEAGGSREQSVRASAGVAAGVGGLVDGEEPLQREARLDDDTGALAEADGVGVVFDGFEEALRFEIGDDALAGGVAIEAVVGRAGEEDVGGLIEDAGAGQVVALADGEVVGVVGGRDLAGAGAELGLAPVVGEAGDLAVGASVYAGDV